MKRQSMTYSKLNCKECGSKFMVPRKTSRKREEGHIKDLYCVNCGKVTKHIEDNRSEAEKFWDKMQEELSGEK